MEDFTSPVHHTLIVGLGVFKILPYRFRPTMRVAALAVATVALIGVPLLMTR